MRSNRAGIRLHLVLNKHGKYRCITGGLCLQMAAYAKSDVKAAGMQQEVSFQYLDHLPFFFPYNFELYIFCTLVFLFCLSFLTFFPFPCRVTREHRENLAKVAKQLGNKAKDSLRRVRSNAVTQVKKAKEAHSEDTIRLVEKQVGDKGFPEI